MEKLCLFRNTNGMKSCYPHNGSGVQMAENFHGKKLECGDTIVEPLRSGDGKFHKVQVVKCKWPECL